MRVDIEVARFLLPVVPRTMPLPARGTCVGLRSSDERPTVSFGDIVYTKDGHRLGEVVKVHADELMVENGLVLRRCYVLACAEIERSDHDVLVTSLTFEEATAREQR